MKFTDGKKDYEINFKHIGHRNAKSTPVLTLKLTKPVQVEAPFTFSDIKTENGATGIKFSQYSEIPKAYKHKGPVLLSMTPEALEYIRSTHEAEIEKLRQAAQKTPEKWFVAIGGDTHEVYATPDIETGTEFREDLQAVQKVIEKISWMELNLKAIGTHTDRSTGLYTFSGWYEVPHETIMKIYEERQAAKEEKKAEEQDKRDAIFQKAKETGEKQILERYPVECSDPDEECDVDIVTIYAMPDGTEKRTQTHTW